MTDPAEVEPSGNVPDMNTTTTNILIVDDDPSIVLLLTRLLESEDFNGIQSTSDPREVRELCLHNAFDIILLDLTMPHMNGYQVIEQLRSEFTQLPPILMLTGRDEKEWNQQAHDTGIIEIMIKPFDPDELIGRIKSLMDM